MPNVRLIVLTGPAAVGKSTIARAVQSELIRDGEIWLDVGLDAFGRSIPRNWIALGTHSGRFAADGFTYARDDKGSIQLTLGKDGRRVLAAFHRSVAAIVRSGVGVVCETIVYDENDWQDWLQTLEGIATCWVRLRAPIELLEEREKADRTRVFQGLARGMASRQAVGEYDIEADTSVESAEPIAHRIVEATRRKPA